MQRRVEVRYSVVAWMKKMMGGGGSEVFGIGDDWRFDYPNKLPQLKIAWQLGAACKFTRIPTEQEVGDYDPRWVSDVLLLQKISDWVTNDSAPMQIFNNPGEEPNAPPG